MAKNIILCADGTGNNGGTTPDSNVYRMYKSVNKHFKGQAQDGFAVAEQILFYDNGVGTAKNKYLRALGGAFGFGFEDNVCDLYTFLARNYEAGDRVYFFGFSRGASTVRACNGFISICGLIKGQGLHHHELKARVKEAFSAYQEYGKQSQQAQKLITAEKVITADNSHGAIDIHFMGLWDTVVALGFPKRTDVTGPVSATLNVLFWLAEKGLDRVWPHNFYYYKLTENVLHAHQALAIDDERTAFWPYIWNEQGRTADTVEQVWFAGMHSNVGGGYARSGMASVALHWMMLRAQHRGLTFDADAVQEAFEDSHVHGRMYNSRDGLAIFYRYHPRELEKLCAGRLVGKIKLHRSVLERSGHRTANYAPGQLPGEFTLVTNDPAAGPEHRHPGQDPRWKKIRSEIDRWVLWRKGLYAAMLTFVLTMVGVAGWLWVCAPLPEVRGGFGGHLADILDYFLPDFFGGLIELAVVQRPSLFIGAATLLFAYVLVRSWCRDKTVAACERLRQLVISADDEHNGE